MRAWIVVFALVGCTSSTTAGVDAMSDAGVDAMSDADVHATSDGANGDAPSDSGGSEIDDSSADTCRRLPLGAPRHRLALAGVHRRAEGGDGALPAAARVSLKVRRVAQMLR